MYTTCQMQVICLFYISSILAFFKTKTNVTAELMQMIAMFLFYLSFHSYGHKTHSVVLYV